MTQHSFTKYFSESFGKSIFDMPNASFDIQALLEIQKKNMVAFTEMHKLAFDGIQAVTQRQAELISKTVKENSSLFSVILSEDSPEKKAGCQADLVKKGYEASIAGWQELSGLIDQSGKEAVNIFNDRIKSSISEFQSAMKIKRGDSNTIVKNKAA